MLMQTITRYGLSTRTGWKVLMTMVTKKVMVEFENLNATEKRKFRRLSILYFICVVLIFISTVVLFVA